MIVVVDSNEEFCRLVSSRLRSHDVVSCTLEDLEEALSSRSGDVDAVLFGPSNTPEECQPWPRQLQRLAPGASSIVVVEKVTQKVLQDALRSGIRDILPRTFTPAQLEQSIARAEETASMLRESVGNSAPVAVEQRVGKVITVFSPKGGAGASVVSTNLAIGLAKHTGQPVALVDLDLQFGDTAIMMQLVPSRTIFHAAENIERLDPEAMRGYLTHHNEKVDVLAAPSDPGQGEQISDQIVKEILSMLKETYAYIVVDTPSAFTDQVLVAIENSDRIVLVSQMDVPSMKNLKLGMQTMQILGVGREKLHVVLNRADSKVGLNVHEIEKTLGTKIDFEIPSSKDVPVSVNRGTPLIASNPRSTVAQAIEKIVDVFALKTKRSGSRAQPHSSATAALLGIWRVSR